MLRQLGGAGRDGLHQVAPWLDDISDPFDSVSGSYTHQDMPVRIYGAAGGLIAIRYRNLQHFDACR